MTDKGTVVSINNDLAQVEVQCLTSCHDCAAHKLCIVNSTAKGVLAVKNPVKARPGDEVAIEIPESQYSRSLILLFGSLLVSALLGLGAGYLVSVLLHISTDLSGPGGLLSGILIGAGFLAKYLRNEKNQNLYPFITHIVQKGACHG